MSVRRIPMNFRNVTGYLPNRWRDEPIGYESSLERDFVLLAMFCRTVTGCVSQPLNVFWHDAAGLVHQYTPDYSVNFAGDGWFLDRRTNRPWMVEIKYQSDLTEYIAIYRRAFQAAVQEAYRLGMYFKVITDRQIRIPLLRNARFLLPYTNISPDPSILDLVANRVAELGSPTLRQLVNNLSGQYDKGIVLQALWHLVSTRRLFADLSQPLVMETTKVTIRGRYCA